MANKKIINVEVSEGNYYNQETGDQIDPKLLKSHLKKHEFRIVGFDKDLATGIHINKYEKTSIRFLADLKNYVESSSQDIKQQIDIANKMFRFEDVVSTGLEILIDFTISNFELNNIHPDLKLLADELELNVNKMSEQFSSYGLFTLMQDMAYEYFISGNIFPAERWEEIDIEGKSVLMPVEVKLMNPENIDIDENSTIFGEKKMFFTFGRRTKSGSLNSKDLLDALKPANITSNPLFIKINNTGDPTRGLGPMAELDTTLISHLKRKSRDYDVWGIPYLTKLAQAVTYKQKLWQLDLNTIDGLLNFITIFKIGSPDKDSPFHNPPKSRLSAFASLLKNPQASTMMVWPHDVDVITAGPDGNVLSFADKYKEANRAIIQGLGVPPILIDGSGTATAAFVTVIALNKRLETVRQVLRKYVIYLIRKIAEMNDMTDKLTGKESLDWFPSELRNESQVKQLLLAFYDRGLLPIRTTHNQGGYRHEDMVEFKEEELTNSLEDLFARPDIPFSPQSPDQTPGKPSDTVDTTEQDENKEKQESKNVTSDLKFVYSSSIIADKYEEDFMNVIDNLEKDIIGLKKRSQAQIDGLLDVAFIRLEQISDIFGSFDEKSNNMEFATQLDLFHSNYLTKLKDFIRSNMTRTIIKYGTDKELMISGIISQAKKRAKLFVKESLRNIDLMQLLTKKKKEGMIGAIIKTSPDTNCEFCKELNNEFMTLTEIAKEIPSHIHQGYTFEFSKEDKRKKGKKKKKTLVKNPRNKSKYI